MPEMGSVLRIGGFDYKIRLDEDRKLLQNNQWGETDSNNLTMTLDSEAPLQRQRETLLHEALHAASGILPPEDQLNERQVRSLAIQLFQAIRDNPWFWRFVGEEEDGHPTSP